MEAKHTKGEWKIRFFGGEDDGENMFFVEAPNLNKPELGYGIEIMMEDFGDHNGYPREQRLADAKLIVASKAMLKALKSVRKLNLHLMEEGTIGKEAYNEVMGAIKKATE